MKERQKLIVITGPTATGKSALGVALARALGGEIISADSRQVYKGLDIGTGKITRTEMRGARHHLLDVTSPKRPYSVSAWKKLADRAIRDIVARGKTPIVVGGTGFYIDTLVGRRVVPEVPPNVALRMRLSRKKVPELFSILRKLDSRRAAEIDRHNPVRLIRAIEIATALGKVPSVPRGGTSGYEVLWIGVDLPDEKLKEKILARIKSRMRAGMIAEARRLRRDGLSWKRFYSLGLEYRLLARLLKKEITEKEFLELLAGEIWQYVRRQRQWWKTNKEITWFSPKKGREIIRQTHAFLKK